MNRSVRRLIIALLLAVVVYGAFVLVSGHQRIQAALATFHWPAFFYALCLSSANYVFRFVKWEFYLRRLDVRGIPWGQSFLVFLSGFVLTVTPGKVGEVFKSAVLSETHGVDPARTAPIIVAERLTDVIAIVALIAIGSVGFSSGASWALAGAAAVAMGLSLILWRTPLEWLVSRLGRGGPWGVRMAPRLRTFVDSLRVVAHPTALLVPTALSIIGWGFEGVALWLLVEGFGEVCAFPLALFIYATATLAGALVPLPGGLGVAEAMFQTQMVELAGVEVGAATASMLMIRFATLWWAVMVGFAALFALRLIHPGLFRAANRPGAS